MAELREIMEVLECRAQAYREWDYGLKVYLEDREHERYNELVQASTQRLKDIRLLVKGMDFPEGVGEIVAEIENLEDTHLRAKVEYHKSKITGNEAGIGNVREIENQIMEQIQEIVASYS